MTQRNDVPCRRTPPCEQVCWETVATTSSYVAWRWVPVDEPCDHWYDSETGIWRWGHHAPEPIVVPPPVVDDRLFEHERERRDLW